MSLALWVKRILVCDMKQCFHWAFFHLTMCSLTQNNIFSVYYSILLILKTRTDSPVKIRTRNQQQHTPCSKTFLSVLVSTNLFKTRKWISVWLNFMQIWGRCHLKGKWIIHVTAKRLDVGKDRLWPIWINKPLGYCSWKQQGVF